MWEPVNDGDYAADSRAATFTIDGEWLTTRELFPNGEYHHATIKLPSDYRLCRQVADVPSSPLDAPNGPGHWALKARIQHKYGHWEYAGTAYIMPDDLQCKRVRIDGQMIKMIDVLHGKWYRLSMPWEATNE